MIKVIVLASAHSQCYTNFIFQGASVFICFVGTLLCAPEPQGYGKAESNVPATFKYQYQINDLDTSNNFGKAESRNGFDTQGEYFVNLPDGRLQKVSLQVED